MKKIILVFALLLGSYAVQAQIGIGTPSSNPSVVLELTSTSKGFIPPRLTTAQRNAIALPAAGYRSSTVGHWATVATTAAIGAVPRTALLSPTACSSAAPIVQPASQCVASQNNSILCPELVEG